jgi:hypothetical protein
MQMEDECGEVQVEKFHFFAKTYIPGLILPHPLVIPDLPE